MYVAFTRPIDRLYVYHQYKERKSSNKVEESTNLNEHLIGSLFTLYPEGKTETGFNYTLGSKPEITPEHAQPALSFTPTALGETLWFPDISLQSTEEEESSRISKQQRLGNEFHYLMEHASNQEEAEKWCVIGIRKGVIESRHASELLELTGKAFQDRALLEVLHFGDQLDERTIMISENERLRPDKLIVSNHSVRVLDFKTGEASAKHEKQVLMYCNYLQEIGYTRVEGYLYYAGGVGLKQIR
jgi:ATP-dependent exoDNAse (exonuclease V) beta subunit